jgi:hypothetical protein
LSISSSSASRSESLHKFEIRIFYKVTINAIVPICTHIYKYSMYIYLMRLMRAHFSQSKLCHCLNGKSAIIIYLRKYTYVYFIFVYFAFYFSPRQSCFIARPRYLARSRASVHYNVKNIRGAGRETGIFSFISKIVERRNKCVSRSELIKIISDLELRFYFWTRS